MMAWQFHYQYNLSRSYPVGRYTTLIVTPLALTICVLLVLINVPLSAYETQQDFTYTPNSTTNALLFSNLIPAPFQKHSVQFTPHTFMKGENFQTDLGALGDYTMISAYSRNDTPGSSKPLATSKLPSFAYMNYDLSTCDVSSITLAAYLQPHEMMAQVIAIAVVTCWFPLFFQFEVSLKFEPFVSGSDSAESDLGMAEVVSQTLLDFAQKISYVNITQGGTNISGFNITYYPCCTTCNQTLGPSRSLESHQIISTLDGSLLLYDHPACDDQDVNFNLWDLPFVYPSSGIPTPVPMDLNFITTTQGFLTGTFINAPANFSELNYNVLHAVYHGVRLDIGVIRPNQIYNSPTRFNASISELSESDGSNPVANILRAQREAVGKVDLSRPPYNKRVPKVLYLTSVLTPKPLGQAIAAVFVAAFSMITALWHVVNFIVSSLVTRRSKLATFCPCPSCQGHDVTLDHVPMRDDPEWAPSASESAVGSGTAYEPLELNPDSSKH
ncbi:hypothetical protein L208DRAFT_1409930, partial [Tricholoma matsutake]